MPKYIEILPDGTRREVRYRMKDCPVVKKIRLTQMAIRLERQQEQGVISPKQRRDQWHQIKTDINKKFSSSARKHHHSAVES